MAERYDPAKGFWRPKGRRPSTWVRDTAETLLSVQEYAPPRPTRVHFQNLPADQQARESAYRVGEEAFRLGKGRDSSIWHRTPRERRSTKDDIALAAFEQGWDTASRRVGGVSDDR